jgi:hypothetical protein
LSELAGQRSEPNGGFWTPGPINDPTGSPAVKQATYFQLYKETADALKRVSATNNLVGGPATAGCPGWSHELVEFAASNRTSIDFVSCHVYGGGGNEAAVGGLGGVLSALPSTKKAAAGLPVVITEWSSSWM